MNEWASSASKHIAGVLSIRFMMPGVELERVRDVRNYWQALIDNQDASFPGSARPHDLSRPLPRGNWQ
jgi:hypothetical protein